MSQINVTINFTSLVLVFEILMFITKPKDKFNSVTNSLCTDIFLVCTAIIQNSPSLSDCSLQDKVCIPSHGHYIN